MVRLGTEEFVEHPSSTGLPCTVYKNWFALWTRLPMAQVRASHNC